MLTDLVRVSWFCRTAVCSTVGIFVTFWRNLNKYSVRQLFLIIASVFCSLCLISYFILSCDFHLFFPPFHSPFISLFVSLCLFLHPLSPSHGYARVQYYYNSGLASSVFAETANSYSM